MPGGTKFLLGNCIPFPCELLCKYLINQMSHNPIKASSPVLVFIYNIFQTHGLFLKNIQRLQLKLLRQSEIKRGNQSEQNKIPFALIYQNTTIHSLTVSRSKIFIKLKYTHCHKSKQISISALHILF